jgi:multidrug efflux pump subunit AcrA (membrane-fusion protein)
MAKKIILGIIIVGALAASLSFVLLRGEEGPIFTLAEVSRGNISQEVLETGTVVPANKIELQFETTGKIKSILIKESDKVVVGQSLIKLENDELYIQKQQAQAALDLAEAKLDQLMAGESQEQIKIYETAMENAEKTVEDAEIALANAIQSLENVKSTAETNLAQAYESSLNALDDAYLKSYNALNTVDLIQRTYFDSNDQASIRTKESEQKIEDACARVEACIASARQSAANQDIDFCSNEANKSLNEINSNLISVRNTMEEPIYRNVVSSTDKTSLDNQRTYINIEITENITAQQNIASKKLLNQTNIDTAQTSLDTAKASLNTYQGQLKTAQDNLALAKAEPRQTDIALHQAQIKEARASLSLIQKQIEDTVLRAPINGTITNVYGEIGETAKIGSSVVVMISEREYQIEIDIPEADIGLIDLAQAAKITLDAFPEQEFSGNVVEIEPAETIIQGVVYYKTKIGFSDKISEIHKGVKSGMTANIIIIIDSKENVLIVPLRAIKEKDNVKFVRVLFEDNFKEIEVEIGLRSNQGTVEIISGLNEGDKVITFIKEE